MSLTAERTESRAPLAKLPGGWELSVRAFRCWLVMYRRTWRASVWSSVLGPLFYLGAMGYGLGSLVDKNGTASLGGVPYVVFVAPGGARRAGDEHRAHQLDVPGLRRHALEHDLRRGPGDHAPPGRHQPRPPAVHHDADRDELRLLRARDGRLRADQVLVGGAAAAGLDAARPRVRRAGRGLDGHADHHHPDELHDPVRLDTAELFSGTFFPISQLPAWIRPLAYATPLWHGVALCRSLALGTVTAGSAAIHVGYLAAMAAIGLWAGARSYRRRLYV